MYGSIRKSYGARKSSCDNTKKERRILFGAKKKNNVEDDVFQETSYMNVESARYSKNNTKQQSNNRFQVENDNRSNSSKSEFPIASVILTIVFTMMVMVLAFGFGGI